MVWNRIGVLEYIYESFKYQKSKCRMANSLSVKKFFFCFEEKRHKYYKFLVFIYNNSIKIKMKYKVM